MLLEGKSSTKNRSHSKRGGVALVPAGKTECARNRCPPRPVTTHPGPPSTSATTCFVYEEGDRLRDSKIERAGSELCARTRYQNYIYFRSQTGPKMEKCGGAEEKKKKSYV